MPNRPKPELRPSLSPSSPRLIRSSRTSSRPLTPVTSRPERLISGGGMGSFHGSDSWNDLFDLAEVRKALPAATRFTRRGIYMTPCAGDDRRGPKNTPPGREPLKPLRPWTSSERIEKLPTPVALVVTSDPCPCEACRSRGLVGWPTPPDEPHHFVWQCAGHALARIRLSPFWAKRKAAFQRPFRNSTRGQSDAISG